MADKEFLEGDFGYLTGAARTFDVPIAGTTDDPLYQSLRYVNPQSPTAFVSYAFDGLPAGDYDVTLYFVEPMASSAVGNRLIDVWAEEVLVIANLDIFEAAGATRTSLTESLIVSVIDGRLDLDFERLSPNHGIVSAIAVVQIEP